MSDSYRLPSGTFTPDDGGGGGMAGFGVLIVAAALFGSFFDKKNHNSRSQTYSNNPNARVNQYPIYSTTTNDGSNYYYERIPQLDSSNIKKEITPELVLLYYNKINKCNQDTFANEIVMRFDANYSDYLRNEFEIRQKIEDKKESIKQQLKSIAIGDTYDIVFSSQFSKYDFDKKCFNLINFPHQKSVTSIVDEICCENKHPGLSIVFLNLQQFNQSLNLEEKKANELIIYKNNSIETEYERTLYLKIFYSILDKQFSLVDKNNEVIKRVLFARISRVEVWADSQTKDWKVTELLPFNTQLKILNSDVENYDSLIADEHKKYAEFSNQYGSYIVRPFESFDEILNINPKQDFEIFLNNNSEIKDRLKIGQPVRIIIDKKD